MSLEDPTSSGCIEDTTEWKLIYGLCQNSHHFGTHGGVAVGGGSTRTQELRNGIYYLDVQIRRTFTTLQLDLLLYLESEIADDVSQASSESVTDEDSSRDSSDSAEDDASSQSSVESHLSSPPDELLDSPGYVALPSADEALSHLRGLCSLLEARVNPSLIPVESGDSDQTRGYPRLTRLIEYLQSLSPSATSLEFIAIPRSTPTQFIFNVAEDTATADAFVSFSDPKQKRPHKETRQRMLKKAKLLSDRFFAFNSFVDKLQISAGSLDNLATQPIKSSTSNESFASFALLQKFHQQTAAACRAIFSQFELCDRRGSTKHKVRLQLPGWDNVSDYHSTDEKENLPVQLLLTMCPHEDCWQPARMYLLQSQHSQHTNVCTQGQFCKLLRSSHNNDMDLQFYVSENCKIDGHAGIPIHIPTRPERTRICGDSSPSHMHSLWTLVKRGYFAKEQTMDLLHSSGGKDSILSFDQRKTLGIKLILGLMLSMDSDHVFQSWDPKRIHFLKPVDTQNSPFISISRQEDRSRRPTCLALARLYPSGNFGEYEDDLTPLPQFALLAKALLQIACGGRLDSVKISQASERAFLNAWKDLRRTIDRYSKMVTCEPEVDLETLPFLRAALGCLDFHMEYQQRVREAQSSQKMDIAWKLVFDTILVQIDDNLTLEKSIKPSIDALTKEEDHLPVACEPVVQEASVIDFATSTRTSSCTAIVKGTLKEELSIRCVGAATTQPSQPNVVLFDAKQAAKPSTADEFWKRLEKFHESYSRFVTDRITEPGVESPRRIRIAVLDTGIDFRHSGIIEAKDKGRMKEEWCHSWVGADAKDDDDELHGTNCAYLLHKAAPEADIYVEKVFNRNALRFYEAENIAKAIKHAANTWSVDIISMSFGLRRPAARDDGNEDEERVALEKYKEIVDDIENAIREASIKSPRIMFAAASNNGKNEPRAFPASYNPWVICVHASEGNGEDGGINPEAGSGFNFMTLGMGLELMEREFFDKGGKKFSKYKKVVKSGTSFATPIAAGIAAIVLDLAARVDAINTRAKKKLRRSEEMEKLLRIMSTPKNDVRDRLYYMAPWHHWGSGWERDESDYRWVWDTINKLF